MKDLTVMWDSSDVYLRVVHGLDICRNIVFLWLDCSLYCPSSYRDLALLLLKGRINIYMQSDEGAEYARCWWGKGFGPMTFLSLWSWDCKLAFSLNRFSTCCMATVSWISLYIVSFRYKYAMSLVDTYFRLLSPLPPFPLSAGFYNIDIVSIDNNVDVVIRILFLAMNIKVSYNC